MYPDMTDTNYYNGDVKGAHPFTGNEWSTMMQLALEVGQTAQPEAIMFWILGPTGCCCSTWNVARQEKLFTQQS
jgi:hypothetical protein